MNSLEVTMYRRILVPVDGSRTSMVGLKHALGLAKDQRAVLRILNVVEDNLTTPLMVDFPAEDLAALMESMQEAGTAALKEAADIATIASAKADTIMVRAHGRNVSDVILEQARAFRADLIVMGTHGRRGLNRLVLGSDAERVLRESPVPVLLIRHQAATHRRAALKPTSRRKQKPPRVARRSPALRQRRTRARSVAL
jgi:nucleotide-binding universal stress UspA family protein